MKKQTKSIIKDNYEFQKIIAKQNSLKNSNIVIYFLENNVGFRYGISVGKKLGNAVVRNKLKRQIRMMIHEIIKTGYSKNYDVIVIARKPFLTDSFIRNKKKLQEVLEKLD